MAVEGKDFLGALVGAHPAVEPGGVHFVGAEQVALPAVLAVRRGVALGTLLLSPAALAWLTLCLYS
ncbi:MAG TPA: hypothetical protein VG388_09725 [Solirubrobacteraceae bacterium]|nr:hypothetical protein [Solirubrobacteraceae bacterium]